MNSNETTIRTVLGRHGRLPVAIESIDYEGDLYAAGLKSFASVQVMLALEDAFDVEFPERMLNRATFASIKAIDHCITELKRPQAIAS